MADFHKYKEITQKELVVNERSGNQRWMGILNDVKNEMTKFHKFLKNLTRIEKDSETVAAFCKRTIEFNHHLRGKTSYF